MTNRGLLSPGETSDNPGHTLGELAIVGDFEQEDTGTTRIHFGFGDGGTNHDVLGIDGNATFAGTLELLNLDDFMPAVGTYQIVDVTGDIYLADRFTIDAFDQPLGWDFSNFGIDGSVTVTPTPTASLAGLVAMGMVALRRPRRQAPFA